MKLCLVVAVLSTAAGAAHGVNPIQKVVQLLSELEAKVIKDGEAEQKAYEEYVDWCQNGAKDLEFSVKTAKSDISEQEATITKAESDIADFSSKIEELAAAISANEADLKAATAIRKTENADYVASESELVDALDTLDRAISVLEKKLRDSSLLQQRVNSKDVTQVIKVLQTVIEAASMNTNDKSKLLALAQSDASDDDTDEDAAMGAPDPTAYKSHSGSIIDVLEEMKEKAENQLSEVRKEEMNAQHNYDMLKQSLVDQISADTQELGESKQSKADAQETRAVAEGELSVTKEDLAMAEKVLGSMHVDCMEKAQEHETSVKSRAEELKALAEAKKIIQSTTGGAEDKTYSLLQIDLQGTGKGAESQLQSRADLANFEVVNLIRKIAREQHAPELTQLASRIGAVIRYGTTAGQDPFAKVKELISDMISRLTKEGAEEADHKAYCDAELGKTKKKRMELEHDTETLSAKIDKAKTQSAKLKEQVAELAKEIAEITQNQADSDKYRQDEHAAYLETKADLEEGLEGIRTALKVLKDYYASEAAATAGLLQQPAAPETHSASSAGSGIIGMLEVIESDFAKNLAQAEADEDAAAVAYQKVLLENKVAKTMKERDVKYKTKESASLDKSSAELSSDLEGVQSEYDALLKYTENLRGMCELKPESYEGRKSRREAEIAGLREALAILDSEASFLQRLEGHKHVPHAGSALRGVPATRH